MSVVTTVNLSQQAEALLERLLTLSGVQRRGLYRPGEVCRVLSVSRSTLAALCDLAEHPRSSHQPPQALHALRLGTHRRIPHSALIEWIARNWQFEREQA